MCTLAKFLDLCLDRYLVMFSGAEGFSTHSKEKIPLPGSLVLRFWRIWVW